jgi:hypothetical protein
VKRIKLLLLAALGTLALTATMGAPAASASGISFGQYPVQVKSGSVATHSFGFSGGRSIACDFSELSSSAGAPTETLTVSVTPSKCSNEYEGNVTLKMNGCKFIYHPAVGKGSFDIGPAGCGPITMEGTHCTRTFASQTGFAATFSNEGSPSIVKIQHEASGLQYTITKGGLAACGSSGTATFTGSWELKAFGAEGTQIAAHVVPGTGFYMTGKESGEAGSQPKFEAENYPVTLTGVQDPANKHVLTIGKERKIVCEAVDTSSTVTGATSQLTLNMAYSGCFLEILGGQFVATFKMNGCNFVLNALNVGPPYSGSLGVACGKEGEAIEINTTSAGSPVCTYKISPQSGLTGVGLSNVRSGTERGVIATFGVSGLIVTRAKGTLAACGALSQSSSYAGATTLYGVS